MAQSHCQGRESNPQNISIYSCGCLLDPSSILNHISIFEMASSKNHLPALQKGVIVSAGRCRSQTFRRERWLPQTRPERQSKLRLSGAVQNLRLSARSRSHRPGQGESIIQGQAQPSQIGFCFSSSFRGCRRSMSVLYRLSVGPEPPDWAPGRTRGGALW